MQSNAKVISSLIQKIQSPLPQIRNRAITTLYTKVSAKIIQQKDLTKAKDLPGVLMTWINQTSPPNKDCLYKVLSILHKYTFSDDGIELLVQYEGLQFLQQLRKFLLADQMNVDQHVDIIKKIIKQLLPLDGKRNNNNYKKEVVNQQSIEDDMAGGMSKNGLKQQDQEEQQEEQQKGSKINNISRRQNQQMKSKKQSTKHDKSTKSATNNNKKQQSHIVSFNCLNDSLPKQIDQQLYSLIIQLKHGKKQAVLQTLIKIQQIIDFWGSRYFKYKQDLVKQLVTIIEGKVFSQISIRILSTILKQLIQQQNDLGLNSQNDITNIKRKYHKTLKISDNSPKSIIQKVSLQLNFSIFEDNPFSYRILQTMIIKSKSQTLSGEAIEYLIEAIQKYPYSAAYLVDFLKKIQQNQKWMKEKFHGNKFYQEQVLRMINYGCELQSEIYQDVINQLVKLFPNKSIDQLSSKVPSLQAQLQERQIQQSFEALTKYSSSKGIQTQGFDFNLQLHQLQSHIKCLQKGIQGLPKKPQVISLYIDCMLMLAVSVAKQDPLISYYPKIKSLIMKISQHKYLSCRVQLYNSILITFNSSQKINYLSQSYIKLEIIRLVFTDSQFYGELFYNSLNQEETIGIFLEITKLIQITTKEENHKYLTKFSSIFYILSYHNKSELSSKSSNQISIGSTAKIILSRINKKYQVVNILLTLFLKDKQQRYKTYTNILSLAEKNDILKLAIEYSMNPQKKTLKYSLSTIMNYMNIIMNQKIENQIKLSAINQMIQCVQRIDLQSLQKQQQFLSQILSIHSSIQTYIKSFLQKNNKSEQIDFFLQLVRIYCILQKRLRLQTNYLNQSIKCLQPEIYLNILINICSSVQEESLNSEKFRYVIPEVLIVVYYHCFNTWTSKMLELGEKQGDKNGGKATKNQISVHWIINILPVQQVIKLTPRQISQIGIRSQFFSQSKNHSKYQQKQQHITSFLKGYKLNIKSIKQLLDLYIKDINSKITRQYTSLQSTKNNQSLQAYIKTKRNIICPILERQLSTILHNINSSQNQLSFLLVLFESFSTLNSTFAINNLFQPLQEMVSHVLNQLIKPNIPEYIKIMLVNICNIIGLKRTKQFEGLYQEFSSSKEFYLLKLIKKIQKLSVEQLSKLLKICLNQVQNTQNLHHICTLYQILLKPAFIKQIAFSCSQYTQLLVINSFMKSIQSPHSDNKLINFATIVLYQILNQIGSQIKLVNSNNTNQLVSTTSKNFDYESNQNQNQTKIKKLYELIKLISSLSLGPNLISFVLKNIQNGKQQANLNSNGLSYQNLCFIIETIKIIYKISDFAYKQELEENSQTAFNHENKILKLFLIKINENVRSNMELMGYWSMETYYTTFLGLVTSVMKSHNFSLASKQVDLLDLSLNLLHQKVKNLTKKQNEGKINPKIHQTYLLFSTIFEYVHTRILQQASQNSHYLLSSTNLLQSSLALLKHLYSQTILPQHTVYINQLLQNLAKCLHSISYYQQDYFVFKLNQFFEQSQSHFNLLQVMGKMMLSGGQNFTNCFMRIILIWQGKTKDDKSLKIKKVNQVLNSIQIFQNDSESEDDSSLEERQLFQKAKIPYQNNWIYKTMTFVLERNYLKYCKSLVALSFPAKLFLLENPFFLQYLKKATNLINNKIAFQTNLTKRKNPKKSTIGNNNSSVMLSHSRRTVISQAPSYNPALQDNTTQQQKIHEIQEIIKILISLFALNQKDSSKNMDYMMSKFNSHYNKCKQALRKIFSLIDKLYTLSQLMASNSGTNKQFNQKFITLINSLSQSSVFSLPLSNHLSEVASPMLEQSISSIQKGISCQLNQQQYEKLKQALRILTTLSGHQSVRSYIYKNKLIQELNVRIMKYDQMRADKIDTISLNSLYDIVSLYLNLSKYKDSHSKILNDKRVLQVLINQVYMQKSAFLSQKILQLLSNLCAYKNNKPIFMQNRQIHKTILGQLQSEQIEYKTHLLTLLYNLMYRHAPAVKLYKRKDVVDMLNSIPWKKCQNWEKIQHIYNAVFQVLESQDNFN